MASDFSDGTVDESACQCRGLGFYPWSGKIPHAWSSYAHAAQILTLHSRAGGLQLLSPCATTTEAHAPKAYVSRQEKLSK